MVSVSLTGLTTLTLSANNNATDQARMASINFTGTLSAPCTVTLPSVSKLGWITNSTTGNFNVILKCGGGTERVLPSNGRRSFYSCDGTNVGLVVTGPDANVFCYGAAGDGATDDTAAIQAAINTGRTVYLPATSAGYLVKDALTFSTKGQVFRGDSHGTTLIHVEASFNLSATGVFVASTGEPGPVFRDFKVLHVQPDTATRASLTTYPPTFYMRATPRFRMEHVRVSLATVAVDMKGNSGGAVIDDCEICAFTTNILIDGSLDTVRINNVHIWDFDCTSNQTSIFISNGTTGIKSGRCDGLGMVNCLMLCGTCLNLFYSSPGFGSVNPGATFGYAVGCGFDTCTGIVMSAGEFNIAGSYSSLGSSDISAINMSDGFLTVSACNFQQGYAGSAAVVSVGVTGGNTAYLQLGDSTFNTAGADVPCIALGTDGASASFVGVDNCFFFRTPGVTYSLPTIIVNTDVGCRTLRAWQSRRGQGHRRRLVHHDRPR